MSEEAKKIGEDDVKTEESALLKAYQELKKNSISKEQYEKDIKDLKEKNDLYLDAITKGNEIELENKKDDYDLKKEIEQLSNFKGTNLDFWKKTNKAIDVALETVPRAEFYRIFGDNGFDELLKVRHFMGDFVEKAGNNPDKFNLEYKNNVVDSSYRISSEIEKAGSLHAYLQSKNE